jgi:hypothetical protein
MKTNKDLAIEKIQELANDLQTYVGATIEIDEDIELEIGELYINIKGTITAESIDSAKEEYENGYLFFAGYCYVDDWSFYGAVTVQDEDLNILETIEISDKDFE